MHQPAIESVASNKSASLRGVGFAACLQSPPQSDPFLSRPLPASQSVPTTRDRHRHHTYGWTSVRLWPSRCPCIHAATVASLHGLYIVAEKKPSWNPLLLYPYYLLLYPHYLLRYPTHLPCGLCCIAASWPDRLLKETRGGGRGKTQRRQVCL